ncbi:MAG: SusC/RagA family TonB-linked outer membrane protein [Salinivirgaceae bacterium]|nr:SusC/RagA family TonB-linked outer membrane protein [Salinivirgaceae bacterium]
MKHKHNILVMSAAMVIAPFALSAQTDVEAEEVQDSVYMVKTAFRSVAQNDLLGGVSYVNVEEMLNKNYTTYSLDHMESLVSGWNGKSLWGMDEGVQSGERQEYDYGQGYLVLIDGIPRDANNVQPSEIAQITFLKGANAVVLYGSRAAKGVILITTKRGQAREGLKIDLNVNTGIDVIKELPEYLNAADYMRYYNQACINDKKKKLEYTDEDIEKTESGVNPYRYVDMDFYSSDFIKKTKSRNEAVLELSGGNSRARLYGNINAYTQNDFVKIGEAKDNRINRLSVRGNVDINFNDYISGHIDANATFYDSKHRQYHPSPDVNMTYWRMASTVRPNYPTVGAQLIPLDKIAEDAEGRELVENTSNIFDGCFLAGSKNSGFYTKRPQGDPDDIDSRTLMGQIYAGGELKFTSRQFQFDGGLDFNLGKLIEGLSMKTNFGMDFKTSYNTRFDPKFAVFQPTWGDDEMIHKITQVDGTADEITGQKKLWGTKDTRTLALSFQFNYERSFDDHNVSAILLGNGFQQIIDGEYHNTTNANLGLDLSYNFAHRYYMQFDLAMPHSSKLAPGHRNAFSPSLTLGWNLARESFLDGSMFDDLLVSVSVSQLNEDMDILMTTYPNGQKRVDRYYLYTGSWKADGYQYTWHDGFQMGKTYPNRGENNSLKMIKRKEISVNLKTSMFEHFVTADFTFFKNRMEGYLISTDEDWPSHMKQFASYTNNDVNGRQGFDFAVNFNKNINEVGISFGVVGTYYDTKVIKKLQSDVDLENQGQLDKEGKPIDAIWGYKNLGFFQSQEEIDNAIPQNIGGKLRPGDIRYADLSNNGVGDSVINKNDMVYLGKEGKFGSPFSMGVNMTVKYKNFTFYALCSAKAGAYARKNNTYYQPKGTDKYSVIVKDTWTPDNTDAKYPALTSAGGGNNYAESDFWMYKDNAFKLTKIQVTYDLPKELLGDSFVKGLGAFVSGKDLLTISKERKVMETSIASDPQTRFFQVGVKATF